MSNNDQTLLHLGRWDIDGQPVNIQAAAADAMEWMYLMRPKNSITQKKLAQCMHALSEMAKECSNEQT